MGGWRDGQRTEPLATNPDSADPTPPSTQSPGSQHPALQHQSQRAFGWSRRSAAKQLNFPSTPQHKHKKPARSAAPLLAPASGSLRRAHPCSTKRRDAAVFYAHGSPLIPTACKGSAELQTLRSRRRVAGQEECCWSKPTAASLNPWHHARFTRKLWSCGSLASKRPGFRTDACSQLPAITRRN